MKKICKNCQYYTTSKVSGESICKQYPPPFTKVSEYFSCENFKERANNE